MPKKNVKDTLASQPKTRTDPGFGAEPQVWLANSKRYEETSDVYLTTPDETYTIQEIMQRSIQGMDPALQRKTQYVSEQQMAVVGELFKPDFDLTDRDIVRRRVHLIQKALSSKPKAPGTIQAEVTKESVDALKQSEKSKTDSTTSKAE